MAEKWQNSAVFTHFIVPDRISACVCHAENPLLTERHRVVTFQNGLIDMLQKHATKGRLIHVEGKMQTRRWRRDGEDSDRFSTEIIVVPGNRVQFYDKPNGNGSAAQADPAAGAAQTVAPAPAPADLDDEIPF